MKTSLNFVAPNDLSVGTVRITGEGQTIADWVATPDNRTFQQDDLKPGIYSVEIGPAGVAPQSVVFEVREGQANNVVLPTFSALSSSGSNTNFFDTDNQQTVSEVPYAMKNIFAKLDLPQHGDVAFSGIAREEILDPKKSLEIEVSKTKRRISIGLSEEKSGRETFDSFRGQSRMELVSGRLEIEIPTDPRRDHWSGHRIRLSAAIEQVRVERCLLPLYRGGTRITVTAPPFAAADLELGIMPIDPKLRALVRALDAGTSDEVTAVRKHIIVGKGDPTALLADDADPWVAILVGLLAIRSPEIFLPIDPAWAEELVRRAGWAFDAHVICACQTLSATRDTSSEAQDEAVANAIAYLAKAQVVGPPYYRYTNQLFAEMAAGIASYLKANKPRVDPADVKRFDRLYERWHRKLPLQRGAGSMFTWLARDPVALKERNVLAPYRNPSGKLRRRNTSIIFEGRLTAGQIEIIGGVQSSPESASTGDAPRSAAERSANPREYRLSEMPALARPPGPDDDPNKNRFGGQAIGGGFRLSASFEPTENRNWVAIILTVEADRSTKIGLGDFAWFVLHPAFSPSALRVSFRGNRARLRIQAWGGFTVGVWLPSAGVELECDLSQIEGAPKIIRVR